MMNLFEKLNRLDDSLVESRRVVKKKKLTESADDNIYYEIEGEKVSWSEYFEYMMEEDEYFMDDLYSDFADKAYELVEAKGFTDVFTEPSTQAGRGGDFFWAKKDGVTYRGHYDFESEQQLFYDAAVNASSKQEAVENLAKTYAKLILNNLDADKYDDNIDEMLIEEELTEASQRDLDRVAAKIQHDLPKGYIATGNRSHACVDIKNSDGKVVGQAYPDYSEIEKEYKTLKRVSKDEIEDDDIIYVKRNKTGIRKKMDGIKFVKSVNNIHDTFDSFKNSLK